MRYKVPPSPVARHLLCQVFANSKRLKSKIPAKEMPGYKTALILLISLFCVFISCSQPDPTRIVEKYLDEIGRPVINEQHIDDLTTDHFRDSLTSNSLVQNIMDAGGNYFSLFSPFMSVDDSHLVEENYDFVVDYYEVTEGRLSQVKVTVVPKPKKNANTEKVLASKTLHLLIKDALREQMKLEFLFILNSKEGPWRINQIVYPGILDQVLNERASDSVTLPQPGKTDASPG